MYICLLYKKMHLWHLPVRLQTNLEFLKMQNYSFQNHCIDRKSVLLQFATQLAYWPSSRCYLTELIGITFSLICLVMISLQGTKPSVLSLVCNLVEPFKSSLPDRQVKWMIMEEKDYWRFIWKNWKIREKTVLFKSFQQSSRVFWSCNIL